MEAAIKNTGGDFSAKIKETLAEPRHRYEIQDPFNDTTLRFQTAEEATAKMEELNVTRFQGRDSTGKVSQINKIDGQWIREDGKSLVDVQADIDKESVLAVEIRAEQRALAGQGVDKETDKKMALADATDFRRIQDPALQENAALVMAENTRTYPDYKEGLEIAYTGYLFNPPKISDIAVNVAALDATYHEKKDNITAQDQGSEPDQDGPRETAKFWRQNTIEGIKGRTLESYPNNITDEELYKTLKENSELLAQLNTKNAAIQARYERMFNRRQEAATKQEAKATIKEEGLDSKAIKQVAAARQRDFAEAREALGLNAVEPNIEKQQQKLEGEAEEKRAAWLKKGTTTQQATPSPSDNKVESDEVFTATQPDIKPIIPPDIEKQYLRVGEKFYHPKNTDFVAFEDKGNKLETKSNSENIAVSMVRIAEARGWDEIKVSGSETFRRETWLEGASRGMQVKGYTPSEQDKAELLKRTGDLSANKIEPENKPIRARENDEAKAKAEASPSEKITLTANQKLAKAYSTQSTAEATKQHPELAGAAAAEAAIGKKTEVDGLNPQQRAIVMNRVRQNIVNSIERGDIPQVKIKEEKEVKRDRNENKEYSR